MSVLSGIASLGPRMGFRAVPPCYVARPTCEPLGTGSRKPTWNWSLQVALKAGYGTVSGRNRVALGRCACTGAVNW